MPVQWLDARGSVWPSSRQWRQSPRQMPLTQFRAQCGRRHGRARGLARYGQCGQGLWGGLQGTQRRVKLRLDFSGVKGTSRNRTPVAA
ncbi:hypothetical protein RAA17_01470 [Komagataeibacter rhaeticus]|nr:hypothetical protein [Komagataeibacter rhaeticus]